MTSRGDERVDRLAGLAARELHAVAATVDVGRLRVGLSRRLRMRRLRRAAVATVAAVMVGASVGAISLRLSAMPHRSTAGRPPAAALPSAPSSADRPGSGPAVTVPTPTTGAIADTPYYPEPRRAQVLAAMATYSACMREHGEPGFPAPPSTIGDGHTPIPAAYFGPPSGSARQACAVPAELLRALTQA